MAIPFYKALFHAHIKNALFEKNQYCFQQSFLSPFGSH